MFRLCIFLICFVTIATGISCNVGTENAKTSTFCGNDVQFCLKIRNPNTGISAYTCDAANGLCGALGVGCSSLGGLNQCCCKGELCNSGMQVVMLSSAVLLLIGYTF